MPRPSFARIAAYWAAITLMGVYGLLGRGSPALSAEKPDLTAVLELAPGDLLSIKPQIVIEQCSEALVNKDKLTDALLAAIYERRGDAYLELHSYEQAKQDYDQLLKLRPDEPETRWKRANALFYLPDYQKALAEFKGITRTNPSYAPAYLLVGVCFFYLGDSESSFKYANKAIELDHDLCLAYYLRAMLYGGMQNEEACLEDTDRCLGLNPNVGVDHLVNIYSLRGEVLLELGKPQAALFNFSIARRLGPSSITPLAGLWAVYFSTGKYHLAYQISEELVGWDSKRSVVFTSRAPSLIVVGKTQEALAAAKKAIALEPKNPVCHWRLGNVYFAMEDYGKAFKAYDEALRLNPSRRFALASMAYLSATCPKEKYRDGPTARLLATELCKQTQDKNPRFLMLLAMAHAECGEFAEAARLAGKSLKVAGPEFHLRDEYENRLKLFEQGKPYRFKVDSKAFDYLSF